MSMLSLDGLRRKTMLPWPPPLPYSRLPMVADAVASFALRDAKLDGEP
jgi:hypothetical protein